MKKLALVSIFQVAALSACQNTSIPYKLTVKETLPEGWQVVKGMRDTVLGNAEEIRQALTFGDFTQDMFSLATKKGVKDFGAYAYSNEIEIQASDLMAVVPIMLRRKNQSNNPITLHIAAKDIEAFGVLDTRALDLMRWRGVRINLDLSCLDQDNVSTKIILYLLQQDSPEAAKYLLLLHKYSTEKFNMHVECIRERLKNKSENPLPCCDVSLCTQICTDYERARNTYFLKSSVLALLLLVCGAGIWKFYVRT